MCFFPIGVFTETLPEIKLATPAENEKVRTQQYLGLHTSVCFLSDHINIEHGCHQGDPVAPYLFILCVQILCLMVMHNKDVKGILFNNAEIKMSQYADNTTLVLYGSGQSLIAALNTLEIYRAISGLLVNTDKTKDPRW